MTVDTDYIELLVAHQPAKPRTREELTGMTALLESLAENETVQSPALVMQYEEEIEPGPDASPGGGSGADSWQQVRREPDPVRASSDQ